MCGIFCILCKTQEYEHLKEEIASKVLPVLLRRGPDVCKTHVSSLATSNCSPACAHSNSDAAISLAFTGTVLHLRGAITEQPLVDAAGNVFLWNGEVFGGSVNVKDEENDTLVMFEQCTAALDGGSGENFARFLSSVHGPWALMYFQSSTRKLWFARDYFGRRSLLQHLPDSNGKDQTKFFSISSVALRQHGQRWREVPAGLLYTLDVNSISAQGHGFCIDSFQMTLPSFSGADQPLFPIVHRCMVGSTQAACCSSSTETFETSANSKRDVTCLSSDKVTAYKETSGKTCQFFSSSGVCGACRQCATEQRGTGCLPGHDRPSVSDCASDKQTADTQESSEHRLLPEDVFSSEFASASRLLDRLYDVLLEAVRARVFNLPRPVLSGPISTGLHPEMTRPHVGILFSGGIDSMVLAALCDRCVPVGESIDLINVAFEAKSKVNPAGRNSAAVCSRPTDVASDYNVPDRITGRAGVKELNRNRSWNFIEVDVSLEELQAERARRIADLVYPLDSVLDDSIGCAIWFAARGQGKCYRLLQDGEFSLFSESYLSPVKVLLTGMGADEQFGGYARHRTKFESFGWQGLREEMDMEIERISSRNLGRDDRCISDHGREARSPFLDENVVHFLRCLPACVKCDPRLPRGVGEKIALRQMAARNLMLTSSCYLPKRAIQFGSRIAKLEGRKERGSDKCDRLYRDA